MGKAEVGEQWRVPEMKGRKKHPPDMIHATARGGFSAVETALALWRAQWIVQGETSSLCGKEDMRQTLPVSAVD